MFFAQDARGKIHSAAYIIWTSDCAYYLMGGGDPELRKQRRGQPGDVGGDQVRGDGERPV